MTPKLIMNRSVPVGSEVQSRLYLDTGAPDGSMKFIGDVVETPGIGPRRFHRYIPVGDHSLIIDREDPRGQNMPVSVPGHEGIIKVVVEGREPIPILPCDHAQLNIKDLEWPDTGALWVVGQYKADHKAETHAAFNTGLAYQHAYAGLYPCAVGDVRLGLSDGVTRFARLGAHFSWREALNDPFTHARGLDNTPSAEETAAIQHALSAMERIRAMLGGRVVTVHDWFRAPEVNAAVGGPDNSEFLTGFAVAFSVAPLVGESFASDARKIALGNLRFDRLVCYPDEGKFFVSFDPHYCPETELPKYRQLVETHHADAAAPVAGLPPISES